MLLLEKEITNVTNVSLDINVNELQVQLDLIVDKIANYSADRNKTIISKHIEEVSDANNKLNITQMWKLRKKLCSKSQEKPSAKFNDKGVLVREKNQLKELYKNTYMKRLSHREMKPGNETIFYLKNYLFDLRMKVTSKIKSPDSTAEKLQARCHWS